MSNIMSAKILRHIADLHEAGIVADDAKTNEEWEEWHKSREPVEGADAKSLLHSFPMESRPVAKVHLPQIGDDGRLHSTGGEER